MTGLKKKAQEQIQQNTKVLYRRLKESLGEMEAQLKTLCRSDQLEMSKDLERVVMAGGKRLRPSLAWICHRIGDGKKMEILPLMCMLELMHTASLIHDDVVDDAPLRRGVETIHQTSGRHAAVQSGDFLLARAMEYLHLYRGTGINEALADISLQMCLGEFQQMEHLFHIKAQTQEIYFEQIRRKTAYLLATSCYTGAIAGGLNDAQTEALKCFGEQIGIAFQLKDDVLDFTGTDDFGKRRGQDLRRGIYTLPVLYAFENRPDESMQQLAAKQNKTEDDMEILLQYVSMSQGIEYTEFQIHACSRKALKALEKIPDSDEKEALKELAQALGKRKL
ncbi:Heptaprenyl diphosphate synthase component 2 [uncultured Roseburia sp.]|uniref:Polyprenyl synthetase family protein n=1 Tax=Brotonthovivens ammoniilytica TaxID=2981725 RepID=A0ABT2TJT4_9FIRM|nr:polyprenyl synthetase family protein [Brotonthovivens ammoniilytica]MCU6762468.1 polyprenyl synthetase family protein [Brotonthovivens ammoniilytica]SCI72730.1 Heptaprenyl diphosphate synthase component 2 [uncultured Roseburia sp.]